MLIWGKPWSIESPGAPYLLLGFQVKHQTHEETDPKDAVSMVFQEKKRKINKKGSSYYFDFYRLACLKTLVCSFKDMHSEFLPLITWQYHYLFTSNRFSNVSLYWSVLALHTYAVFNFDNEIQVKFFSFY